MGEIHKLTKDGVTLYPATTTDAVVHPQVRTALSNMINSYNVTTLFPTAGDENSSKYNLQGAISLLSEKLIDNQKIPGIKILFNDVEENTQEWRYLGGIFTDITSWSREDSWYNTISEDTDELESNIINDVLRKSEQQLTTVEKNQVKTNLDIQLTAKNIDWGLNSDINTIIEPGIYTINGHRTNTSDNLPINEYKGEAISGILKVAKNYNSIGQELFIVTENYTAIYTRLYSINTDNWSTWNKTKQEHNLGIINLEKLNEIIKDGNYKAIMNDDNFSKNPEPIILDVISNSKGEISQTIFLTDTNPITRKFIDSSWTDFVSFVTTDQIKELQNTIEELKKTVGELSNIIKQNNV